VLGPQHPDTASSLNNLALLLKTQGDYAAARPLFERALAIFENVLGTDHPNTKVVRGNRLIAAMEEPPAGEG
jgi:tetratricopeptide (TPR) repeat protein